MSQGSTPKRPELPAPPPPRSVPAPLPGQPTKASPETGRILSLVGGAIIALGSLLPWATVATGFGSASVAGTEGDGKITLAVGAAIAILGLFELTNKTKLHVPIFILAIVAGAVGFIDLMDVSDKIAGVSGSFVHASVGVGLYAVVGGAVVALIGGLQKRA